MAERVFLTRDGDRLPKLLLATALMLALIVGSSGGIPARAAQVSIDYSARAFPHTLSLCTGESRSFTVSIFRLVNRAGTEAGSWASGGRVGGLIDNSSVGHFDPRDEGRDVVGQPVARAGYKFVADAPGQTEIELVILATGDEAALGGGWPQTEATVQVEVTDCYEAHTSALASIFTTKDMGGLDKPFLLAGHTPNTHGITTETQVMFFIPNPQDRNHGGHAFIDTDTVLLGGLQGRCTAYFSGRYEVVFYIPPGQEPPPGADVGDLMMYGSGLVECQGRVVVRLDYGTSVGFQISFKPKPRP